MKTKADKKANWLADYERDLTKACPELTGKVDWDTAMFLYNEGITVADAVARHLKNHPRIFGGE